MRATNPKDVENALVVIDTIIDGLRITDRKLNDKCLAAIKAIGGRVKSRLEAALAQAKRENHRRRLNAAIASIEDFQPVNPRAGHYLVEAIIDALRVHNAGLNNKAVDALSCLPVELVNRLVTEAVCNQKKIGYCLRLLKAAEAVDGTPDVSRHIDLFSLTSHKDELIQHLAIRLLWKFGPRSSG